MLKDQFPDIVKDKIGGQKYHCFSKKCRKTFGSRKQLFEHQKIHVSNAWFSVVEMLTLVCILDDNS